MSEMDRDMSISSDEEKKGEGVVMAYCTKVGERLTRLDFDQKRLAFQAFQTKVVADDDGRETCWSDPY